MNPIEILWCWQSLIVALAAAGMTQFVKTAVDIFWGKVAPDPTTSLKDMEEVGKTRRKANIALNRLIFPSLPVLFGALLAMFVLRGDIVAEYVARTPSRWDDYSIYAVWGGSVGMYADYVVSKVKDVLDDLIKKAKPPTTQE